LALDRALLGGEVVVSEGDVEGEEPLAPSHRLGERVGQGGGELEPPPDLPPEPGLADAFGARVDGDDPAGRERLPFLGLEVLDGQGARPPPAADPAGDDQGLALLDLLQHPGLVEPDRGEPVAVGVGEPDLDELHALLREAERGEDSPVLVAAGQVVDEVPKGLEAELR